MCSLLFLCIRKNVICELPEIKFRDQRQATSIFSEQLPHVNISSKQRWRHLASQFHGRRKGLWFFVRKIKHHFLGINNTMQTQSTARFTEKISDHFKEIEPSLQPHLPATSQKVPLEYKWLFWQMVVQSSSRKRILRKPCPISFWHKKNVISFHKVYLGKHSTLFFFSSSHLRGDSRALLRWFPSVRFRELTVWCHSSRRAKKWSSQDDCNFGNCRKEV